MGAQTLTFAEALRSAVRASGLGLERIQARLRARGIEISVATLSCWQTGSRVPGRRGSAEVVAHLEAVLGLSPHELRVLIPPPRRRGPIPLSSLPALPATFSRDEAVRSVAERVADCPGRLLTRISQHDVVTVGEDRRVVALRSRMVMRADVPGVDAIGLTQLFEDPEAGTPKLTVLSGGRVRATHRDPAHRVTASEVEFGWVLRRGETLLLEYEVTSDGPGPADRTYDLSCGAPVRELAVQVRFRHDDPPAWCESYRRPAGGEEVRRRLAVGLLGHAHTIALSFPPGTLGLSWDW